MGRPDLNGKKGTAQSYDHKKGRLTVAVEPEAEGADPESVALRMKNMEEYTDAMAAAEAAAAEAAAAEAAAAEAAEAEAAAAVAEGVAAVDVAAGGGGGEDSPAEEVAS